MDELTREFLIESQEGLDRMERCLTDLEERPNDAALLADIFRSVHTIKGTTGFLGFKRLEKLAHAGENLLGMLREGKLAANALIITGLLQLLDGLRSILKTIEADGLEGDGADTSLIANLEQLQSPTKAEEPKHATRARATSVKGHAARKQIAEQPSVEAVVPEPEAGVETASAPPLPPCHPCSLWRRMLPKPRPCVPGRPPGHPLRKARCASMSPCSTG